MGALLDAAHSRKLVELVERLRAGGAVEIELGDVRVRYAGPPTEPKPTLDERESREERQERERAAAEERRRLEGWSAS